MGEVRIGGIGKAGCGVKGLGLGKQVPEMLRAVVVDGGDNSAVGYPCRRAV